MKEPYSFITIDARPTATIPFKKKFNRLIDLSEERYGKAQFFRT